MKRFSRQLVTLLTVLMLAQSVLALPVCGTGTDDLFSNDIPAMDHSAAGMLHDHNCCPDDAGLESCDCSFTATAIPALSLKTFSLYQNRAFDSVDIHSVYPSPQYSLFRPPSV